MNNYLNISKGYHVMITSNKKYSIDEIDDMIIRTDLALTDIVPEDASSDLLIYSYTSKLAFLQSNTNFFYIKNILRNELKVVHLSFLKNELVYGLSMIGNYGWLSETGIYYDHDFYSNSDVLTQLKIDMDILCDNFPNIEMNITLFDRSCKEDDAKVIKSYVIREGKYKESEKSVYKLHKRNRNRHSLSVSECKSMFESNNIPCILSAEILNRISFRIKSIIDNILILENKYNICNDFESILKNTFDKEFKDLTKEEIDHFERIVIPSSNLFRMSTVKNLNLD